MNSPVIACSFNYMMLVLNIMMNLRLLFIMSWIWSSIRCTIRAFLVWMKKI